MIDILKQYQNSNNIQIFENFFSEVDFLLDGPNKPFTYGWKASKQSYDQGHWNNLVAGDKYESEDPLYDVSDREEFYLKKPWETIITKLGHRRLRRAYYNGYTYGTDGYFHQDSTRLDYTKYRKNSIAIQETVLCYCNEMWKPDWAGETTFMSTKNDNNLLCSVLPKINRVVYFNGEINHCARPVSRSFSGLRTILAFKTIRDFYDERNAIDFIRNLTKDIPHSGRTFFDHLFKCMMMLKESGFPQEVYLAALYHSVYDTEFFKADLNIPRETIKEIIGPDSERLSHMFCTLRPRLETILNGNLSVTDRYHLALIEYVNLVEQGVKADPRLNRLLDIIKQQETLTKLIQVDW